jgi:F-type H+-transporting ATPase subunit b
MDLKWTSTVIALAAFGLLYLFLAKRVINPLFGIIEKRREIVQSQLTSAEENRKQAEALLNEQKEAVLQAKKDAYDIIEQARVTSTKQADDIVAQAKSETVRLKDEAVRDIENEKSKAVAALRNEVGAMSVLIASKIIEKQVDEKSQKELVDHYLNEVGGAK